MSSSRDKPRGAVRPAAAALGLVVLASLTAVAFAQQRTPAATMFEGIGRAATPKEIAAWDIDVRPDLKGLPRGSGSVARGQDVWEAKCASCHGVFGESNEVFNPIAGGTTAADVKSGRVARLTDAGYPGRTTLMKLSSISTLWDYIHRAMPWNAPKSLSVDEVYAVTAFVLNLGGVVPDDFVLSDATMREAQSRLPNRNGMTTDHGLWPGRGLGRPNRPDVRATACMNNCVTEATVASFLPDHARNAHGNLAEQNRVVGAQLGADTSRPPQEGAARPAALPAAAGAAAPAAAVAAASPGAADAQALARKHNCLTCHAVDRKVVGPALRDVAKKHGSRPDAADYLAQRIVQGGTGVWGAIPMPAQNLPPDVAQALARWVAAGAP